MHYKWALSIATLGGLAHGHGPHHIVGLESRDSHLHHRAVSCGSGAGNCPQGQCCSSGNVCGTGVNYCAGPGCQISYSNTSCDASTRPNGLDTKDVPRNTSSSAPYGTFITNCTRPGLIALTFDDGPYIYTSKVLDTLKANNAIASFMINGNSLGKGEIDNATNPWISILKRMYDEGHHIASHTWTHEDLSTVSETVREQQIIYNEMAFRNIFGWFPSYLRPPYGSCTSASGCLDYVTSLGYHIVAWNIDTLDYANDSPTLISNSQKNFDDALAAGNPETDSFISLSHDVHEQTQKVLLPYMIQQARAKGYRLVTVGECLGDPKANWYIDASNSM